MSRKIAQGSRWTWIAGAASVLSLVTCYGTLGLLAVLSFLGVSIALDQTVWAGAIVAFAMLAVLGMAAGAWRHHGFGPLVLALVGAGLITWVMVVSYDRIVEVGGFAALVAAALWDWRLNKRRGRVMGESEGAG